MARKAGHAFSMEIRNIFRREPGKDRRRHTADEGPTEFNLHRYLGGVTVIRDMSTVGGGNVAASSARPRTA